VPAELAKGNWLGIVVVPIVVAFFTYVTVQLNAHVWFMSRRRLLIDGQGITWGQWFYPWQQVDSVDLGGAEFFPGVFPHFRLKLPIKFETELAYVPMFGGLDHDEAKQFLTSLREDLRPRFPQVEIGDECDDEDDEIDSENEGNP